MIKNPHDVLTVVEKAISADELPRDRFRVVENNIVNTKSYVDVMAGLSAISRGMNWVKDYDQYPSRKFEYPFAYLSASLKQGMKVLDAGCSIDSFAPFLASKQAKVFGVDNFASHDVPCDPEYGIFHGRYKGFEKVQIYRKYLISKYGFSVNYYNNDIASMSFPNQSFDRAPCCQPLPGERIVGITFRGKGVVVHAIDCDRLSAYEDQPERWIDLHWHSGTHPAAYGASLDLTIGNDAGVLGRICTLIGEKKANISNLEFVDRKPDFYRLMVDVELRDVEQLHSLMLTLEADSDVAAVERFREKVKLGAATG